MKESNAGQKKHKDKNKEIDEKDKPTVKSSKANRKFDLAKNYPDNI